LEYSPAPDINPQSLDFEEGKITAHNQVMRVLTENGLIGLGIFMALIIATWRRLLSSLGRVADSHQQAFIAATLASLAAACVYSISATPFDVPAVSWPIWLTIGISSGFCEMNAARPPRAHPTITDGGS
jgi:O-antigen ligase